MGRIRIIGTAALGTCLLLAVAVPSAVADADTSGPVLKLPPSAQFVTGTTIGDSTGPFGDSPQTPAIHQLVSWSATDASGICGYDVFKIYNGFAPQKVVSNSLATSYADLTTDYDDQQGGGSYKVRAWKIVARDCAGNTTTASTRVLPVVTQENGLTYGYRGVSITYAGSWAKATCKCWSGDHDQWTATAGASATLRRTWAGGDQAALVMEKAPNRGALAVYVDGVRWATVDTNSSTGTHRAVVWSGRMSAGDHAITLVNLATPGHPRIDLDAVLTNAKGYCNC